MSRDSILNLLMKILKSSFCGKNSNGNSGAELQCGFKGKKSPMGISEAQVLQVGLRVQEIQVGFLFTKSPCEPPVGILVHKNSREDLGPQELRVRKGGRGGGFSHWDLG